MVELKWFKKGGFKMDVKEMNFNLIYDKILEKAENDESFRKKLLKDAKAALKELGIEFPDDVKVKVYENKKDELHMVLPFTV